MQQLVAIGNGVYLSHSMMERTTDVTVCVVSYLICIISPAVCNFLLEFTYLFIVIQRLFEGLL